MLIVLFMIKVYIFDRKRDESMNQVEYTIEKLKELTAIDSPSGFTSQVIQYTKAQLEELGYAPTITNKGCIVCDIGGEGNPVAVAAHIDTLGAVVSEIKANGHLRISNVGGLTAANCETENCRVYTREGNVYEGCYQLINASLHVNRDFTKTERTFDSMEVLLDENVSTKEEVKKLGIENGCFVCFDPRTVITNSGYIKSRFLDDKLSVAMLLAFAKQVKEGTIQLARKTYLFITVYEEVGHGAKAGLPEDTCEILSVDMGCVGEGLECTERQVSICAKDSGGPYDYDVTSALVKCAKENNIDYAVDIYPYYGSDAEAALGAGFDLKHGLIGAGVYASHGYERSHKDGVENTLNLLKAYLTKKD